MNSIPHAWIPDWRGRRAFLEVPNWTRVREGHVAIGLHRQLHKNNQDFDNRWFILFRAFNDDEIKALPVLNQTIYTASPGSNVTITSPSSWNNVSNTVECLGGGSSGNSTSFGSRAGGGGGGYTKCKNFPFAIPGTTQAIVHVGEGGIGITGSSTSVAGGHSWFGPTAYPTSGNGVGARGASAATAGVAGVGGQASGGYASPSAGSAKYSGGNGGVTDIFGGGAAGPHGAGSAPVSGRSGNADGNTVIGRTTAGVGASGTEWTTAGCGAGSIGAGNTGGLYGGGGGASDVGNRSGPGAQGLVVLSWSPTAVGSGTVRFSATGVGTQVLSGVGNGAIGFATEAEGASEAASVGNGSVTFSAAAAGIALGTATAEGDGTVSFDAPAEGASTAAAVGDGAISFDAPAVGLGIGSGVGNGAIAFAAAAVGDRLQISEAVGSASISFRSTAVGVGGDPVSRVRALPVAERHGSDDYASAMADLLPQGMAWPRLATSVLMRVVKGLTSYWGYVDSRAADFLERETDPRLTIEMLPDWERNWGLPDECFAEPLTIEARHKILVQRMTIMGAQSRAFFIGVAAELGYIITTIREFSPFMAGVSRCGDTRNLDDGVHYRWEIGPPEMRFYWVIKVDATRLSWFRAGSGQAGVDPMVRIGIATDLECVLRRWKPAHTDIVFDYSSMTTDYTPSESAFAITTQAPTVGIG